MAGDLRRYARQTQVRLITGGLFLLFIVGDGLILLLYGPQAAALGLICLLVGLAPLALIWLALVGIEWIVRKNAN
ncbi:MAG: hypothetical protein GX495_16695 [Chloroflexi bacterium]|jgi:hypothetical protein|nr:hypothetical protein [Chloroflexota bacterium]